MRESPTGNLEQTHGPGLSPGLGSGLAWLNRCALSLWPRSSGLRGRFPSYFGNRTPKKKVYVKELPHIAEMGPGASPWRALNKMNCQRTLWRIRAEEDKRIRKSCTSPYPIILSSYPLILRGHARKTRLPPYICKTENPLFF